MKSLGEKGFLSKQDFSRLFSNMNKIVEAASQWAIDFILLCHV